MTVMNLDMASVELRILAHCLETEEGRKLVDEMFHHRPNQQMQIANARRLVDGPPVIDYTPPKDGRIIL